MTAQTAFNGRDAAGPYRKTLCDTSLPKKWRKEQRSCAKGGTFVSLAEDEREALGEKVMWLH
jgi:hypothetical protein